MDKSVLGLTVRLRNMKKLMTTKDVQEIDGTFVIYLLGLNIENCVFKCKITSE